MVNDNGISGASISQKRIEKLFSKADKDSNGSLDPSEFRQLFSTMMTSKSGAANAASAIADKIFSTLDTNHDGEISETEFAKFAETVKPHGHHHGHHHKVDIASLLANPDDQQTPPPTANAGTTGAGPTTGTTGTTGTA